MLQPTQAPPHTKYPPSEEKEKEREVYKGIREGKTNFICYRTQRGSLEHGQTVQALQWRNCYYVNRIVIL